MWSSSRKLEIRNAGVSINAESSHDCGMLATEFLDIGL